MPQFTKRTKRTAFSFTKRKCSATCQALPHKPAEPLLHRPWDLQSSDPAPQPYQGHATPNSHPSDLHNHCQTEPLRLAKPAIHRHSRSPPGHVPQACQSRDPHTHNLHSTGPCPPGLHRPARSPLSCAPHTCTSLNKPAQSLPGSAPKAGQAGNPQICTISTMPTRPFRHARPMLQRHYFMSTKRLCHRPMGPHPSATHHRRASNLQNSHTQTGLHAKAVTSEQLTLQFYCSRTGDFFSLL
jgi:hypothetical protein